MAADEAEEAEEVEEVEEAEVEEARPLFFARAALATKDAVFY